VDVADAGARVVFLLLLCHLPVLCLSTADALRLIAVVFVIGLDTALIAPPLTVASCLPVMRSRLPRASGTVMVTVK
jgi:hypothetical protein